jgi:hypothetical protein
LLEFKDYLMNFLKKIQHFRDIRNFREFFNILRMFQEISSVGDFRISGNLKKYWDFLENTKNF